MKQLLLRIPDDLHARLSQRAASQGRSVNALATEVLDNATEGEEDDRRTRLRARAAALGLRVVTSAPQVAPTARQHILDSTRGLGEVLDRLLAEERERL